MNEEVKMLVLPRQSYSDGFEHFHVEVFRILVGHFSKQTKFEINDTSSFIFFFRVQLPWYKS